MFFRSSFLLLYCSRFLSFSSASHFLGGSFTYRHYQTAITDQPYRPVLVEIRFHISNHYFICSPEQVNEHLIVFLIGETVPYDQSNRRYLWHEATEVRRNKDFYRLNCGSSPTNAACLNLKEEIWAYCESANQKSGYSIVRRRFLLNVERFKPMELHYVRMFCLEPVRPFESLR